MILRIVSERTTYHETLVDLDEDLRDDEDALDAAVETAMNEDNVTTAPLGALTIKKIEEVAP